MWWRKLHNIFSRFDTVPACDGRTDRQTDGRPAYIYYVLHDARKNRPRNAGESKKVALFTARVQSDLSKELYVLIAFDLYGSNL